MEYLSFIVTHTKLLFLVLPRFEASILTTECSGPVCWIYVSEIPTARLRGLNVSLAAATQWLFNLVIARSTPVMLQTVGSHGYGTYFIFACRWPAYKVTDGLGRRVSVSRVKSHRRAEKKVSSVKSCGDATGSHHVTARQARLKCF